MIHSYRKMTTAKLVENTGKITIQQKTKEEIICKNKNKEVNRQQQIKVSRENKQPCGFFTPKC